MVLDGEQSPQLAIVKNDPVIKLIAHAGSIPFGVVKKCNLSAPNQDVIKCETFFE